MKKISLIIIAFNLFFLSSFSQTVKEKIDKEHNAANRARADKADVLIQKKTISDSLQSQNITTAKGMKNTSKSVNKKSKHKFCSRKKNTH